MLTLSFSLGDPDSFKEHIRSIEDGARVALVSTTVLPESVELLRLELALFGMELGGKSAKEGRLADTRKSEMGCNLGADGVA